jgi:hypothetical protein
MGHIDNCLTALMRLIADGKADDLPLAKDAIEIYWAATPSRAQKSGLLYIQQILHAQRSDLNADSRTFANTIDALIETKLII